MIIKHIPEDFIVEEIPIKEWDDDGQYVVFKLTKIDMNTEHVVSIISRRFNIPLIAIKYSGTKDRRARTIQYISIPKKFFKYENSINSVCIKEDNIILEHVGYIDAPLSLGTLKGNKFIITIRELGSKEIKSLNNIKKFLEYSKDNENKLRIPNYFDDQRFSSSNYSIGLNIIRGKYKEAVELICAGSESFSETAKEYMEKHNNDYIGAIKHLPKKILMLFVRSVQSYIFNEALSEILLDNADSKNSNIDINSDEDKNSDKTISYYNIDYSIGKFIYYDINNLSSYNSIVENLELPGFDTRTMNHHVKELMQKIGINSRDFIVRALPDLSVEGTPRECFADVENIDIEIIDDRAIIEFELGKGSYATIVIKALVNN